MQKRDLKLTAADGKAVDCHFILPDGGAKVPAMVLASAIHGVDNDLRGIAEEFAARGYIAAAPDLFSR